MHARNDEVDGALAGRYRGDDIAYFACEVLQEGGDFFFSETGCKFEDGVIYFGKRIHPLQAMIEALRVLEKVFGNGTVDIGTIFAANDQSRTGVQFFEGPEHFIDGLLRHLTDGQFFVAIHDESAIFRYKSNIILYFRKKRTQLVVLVPAGHDKTDILFEHAFIEGIKAFLVELFPAVQECSVHIDGDQFDGHGESSFRWMRAFSGWSHQFLASAYV